MKFICPKCKQKFTKTDNPLICPSGHSFDQSREGYVNLLLSQGAGVHGDNKEMLISRRYFLDTGAYLPLAERISALANEHTPIGGYLLDTGCGEGYYTNIIKNALGEKREVYAFDISKDAVRMTAKRNKSLLTAVASSYDMPFLCEEFDTVVNIFSPLAENEVKRVLRRGGRFIMAIPNKRHLFGLKSAIYDSPYENEVADTALDGFALIHTEKISYEAEFTSREDISALFMMTPYAYRTGKAERERAFALNYVKTEIEFIVLVYERL